MHLYIFTTIHKFDLSWITNNANYVYKSKLDWRVIENMLEWIYKKTYTLDVMLLWYNYYGLRILFYSKVPQVFFANVTFFRSLIMSKSTIQDQDVERLYNYFPISTKGKFIMIILRSSCSEMIWVIELSMGKYSYISANLLTRYPWSYKFRKRTS